MTIDAPSEFVKGRSYNIPFTFTYDRTVKDTGATNRCESSVMGIPSGFAGDLYDDKDYIRKMEVNVPSDTTSTSVTLKAASDSEHSYVITRPVVDAPITKHTVTFKVVESPRWMR
ncbi:MAG: hypothetical protein K5770_06200 [Lachnospiraceae bacterium]|nr:hypothetical protein [Lachnospiraceae bacterium]